jgi:hypothetical protein
MRSLLGGAKEALVHDPGAKGPEGEGEAAMTMMVIVYAVALGLFIYGTHRPPHMQRSVAPRRDGTPTPTSPSRRSPRRGGWTRTRREARGEARREAQARRARRRHARRRAAPTTKKRIFCRQKTRAVHFFGDWRFVRKFEFPRLWVPPDLSLTDASLSSSFPSPRTTPQRNS